METAGVTGNEPCSSSCNNDILHISSNWRIINNKNFSDSVTTVPLSTVPRRTELEEIVSLNTCIALQKVEGNNEACMVEIRLRNGQKIARISVASEACVLEFFKEYGEYSNTVFAEFIDEYEENSVYFAETVIEPHATEAGIKFIKTKSQGNVMWIYGIQLVLTEVINENKTDVFDYNLLKRFLTDCSTQSRRQKGTEIAKKILEGFNNNSESSPLNRQNLYIDNSGNQLSDFSANVQYETEHKNECTDKENIKNANNAMEQNVLDIKMYIDNKFHDMETKLMKRIDDMQYETNQKLDIILKKLELNAK